MRGIIFLVWKIQIFTIPLTFLQQTSKKLTNHLTVSIQTGTILGKTYHLLVKKQRLSWSYQLPTSSLSCIVPKVLMPSQSTASHEQKSPDWRGDTLPRITVPPGRDGSARQRCYKGWSCYRQSRKKEALNTNIRIGETCRFWFSRKKTAGV